MRRLLAALILGFSLPAVFAEDAKPWQGEITEQDLRRKDLLELIRKKQIPSAMKLRYSRTESDFVVFYDIEGKDIYFRYREDRFDTDAAERIAKLAAGRAYEITGTFAGMMQYSILYSEESPKFNEMLSAPDAVPVFLYRGARPLQIDQILF